MRRPPRRATSRCSPASWSGTSCWCRCCSCAACSDLRLRDGPGLLGRAGAHDGVNTLVVMEIFHLFFIRNIYGTSLTWKAVRGTRVVWIPAPVPQPADLRTAGRRSNVRGPRPRHRRGRHPRRRAAERGHRLHPGGPRRAGARRRSAHDRPARSVMRDGRRTTVAAEDIVPGDLVCSRPATVSPPTCGCRAQPAHRRSRAHRRIRSRRQGGRPGCAGAALGDRTSMAYLGTLVAAGQGPASRRYRGRDRTRPHQRAARRGRKLETPLLRQMDRFARQLTSSSCSGSAAVFAFAHLARGYGGRGVHGRRRRWPWRRFRKACRRS
jgi:hypothetical protein